MRIRKIRSSEIDVIKQVSSIHVETFDGFFLTFMGEGFLTQMYKSYCEYKDSGVLVAFDNEQPIGFLAYSGDLSGLYKYMIKKRLVPFAWYSMLAFFKKPSAFMHLLGAFLKPGESKREEAYVELASIGVSKKLKSHGVGSKLIDVLKKKVDFSKYSYITLETDAVDNEAANKFYLKNGFVLEREYTTREGRKMNEYRFSE